ncbi:hypothetical protein B0H17DRAFT_1010301 [Mycena rosella]|uniref:Uncharacterized protein n=1 Tax=Mycena rosella TaxID=1033263 RepID=A0AAD7DJN6_MYCRO|nr:hypothetical protein B0H17DRAFT_1010301 [Mycena rosella]
MACSRSESEQPPQDTAGPFKRAHYYSGLGFRPPKYKHSLADYRAYVSLRRAFLRGPRGRAALLYGGVVGRLARSDWVDVDQIFRGPSADVRSPKNRIYLWDGRTATACSDDRLSDHEIELICGVYHVATGQTDEHGAQTTSISWWRRPGAVVASGNNAGWWTPMWETFYQKRLQQLESGNAGILANHAKWKHNLKLERGAHPFVTANEACSAHILACLRP